jgi:tetratricopeptide (TPR) repeat protein
METADPALSAFDELLDSRFRGKRVDPDAFLAAHPEISDAERELVRRLCRSPAAGEPSPPPKPPAVVGAAITGPPIAKIGGYTLGRRLGAGGMAAVFLAEDESLGRPAAVKILGPDLLGTGERAERFLREARTIARLRHPNIVEVYSAGEQGGFRYIAMELVTGSNIHELISEAAARGTRPPAADVIRWGLEIARALQAAHEAGIVHRDVKPSNIRVTEGGRAVLLDFGLVREDGADTLTESGAFRGSPQYASPEQVGLEGVPIDARTDVYSLGATLYEALTGVAAFRGETRDQLFHHILERDPVPLRRLDPSISRDLETIVLAALEKHPARRYATAAALAADLEAARDGKPISVRPISVLGRAMRWTRRQPVKAALAVTAVAAVLTAAILGGYLASNLDRIKSAADAEQAGRLASIIQQAFLEYGEGDQGLAHELFQEALGIDPASPEARAGFALCRIAGGDPQSAIDFLEGPGSRNDPGSWIQRILTQAKVAKAAAEGTKVTGPVLGEPSSALDHFVAGMSHLRSGCEGRAEDAAAAFEHLRLAVQGSARATPLYFHELGHAAWHAKRDKEAREIAADVARLWPPSPEHWFAIGRTLLNADHEAAIDAFEKAAAPPPRSQNAREHIAVHLSGSGRPHALETAVALARECVRSGPSRPHAHVALGAALRRSNDVEGAVREFREAIRLNPSSAEANGRLAQTLVLRENFKEAVAPGRTSVRVRPHDPHAWNVLGVALKEGRDGKDVAEALQCFERALVIDPGLAEARCNLGLLLVREGDFAKGVENLRKGHEQASKDPTWKYPSGKWLENAERFDALDRRFAALARGEGRPPSVEERVQFAYEVCFRRKRFAESAKIYDEVFRAHPSVATQKSSTFRRRATADALNAGSGAGADAPADEGARRRLRDLARSWFADEIADYEESGPGANGTTRLEDWTKEPTLRRTRPPAALEALTQEERDEWAHLWDRFDALRRNADSRISR